MILMQGMYMVEAIPKVLVLLEALSLDRLVCYFQIIHNNDIFEAKGVHIN